MRPRTWLGKNVRIVKGRISLTITTTPEPLSDDQIRELLEIVSIMNQTGKTLTQLKEEGETINLTSSTYITVPKIGGKTWEQITEELKKGVSG